MRAWKRPGLFMNWLELAVWGLLSLAFILASAVAVVAGHPLPGAALLAAHTFIVWRKFAGRVRDMREVAYVTVQGVSCIFRDVPRLAQIDVEAALQKAIAAHGNAGALRGYCLVMQRMAAYAGPQRVHGVTDGGYMTVSRPEGMSGATALAIVTHEAAHALLLAKLPVQAHHAEMAQEGTI